MTRCASFWRKWEEEGNFCGLDPSEVSRIKAYLEFVGKIEKTGLDREFVFQNFSEGAARPLIAIKDDETRLKGVNYVVACLKRKEKVTAGDLQQTLKGWLKDASKPCSVNARSEKLTNVKKKDQLEPEIEKEPVLEKQEEPEPGIIPFTPPKPKQAPCISGGKCPDGFNHIVQDKVQGAMCFLWKHSLKQLPGDECYLDAKKRQATTKPGMLDKGNTAFSRAGELPKAETKWGMGKILTREEKMHILCTQILIPKQVQVLTAIVKTGEADDELMALDVIIQEAAERMEGK